MSLVLLYLYLVATARSSHTLHEDVTVFVSINFVNMSSNEEGYWCRVIIGKTNVC